MPNATILIVDDDEAVAGAMATLLDVLGYRAVAGEDSSSVRARLHPGDAPALVISDYHLSGAESGVEVIANLRARLGEEIPAILMSGDPAAAAEAAQTLASCRLVAKPVDADALVALVDRLLSRKS